MLYKHVLFRHIEYRKKKKIKKKKNRKTFEKLNFCNIMDLQLKLSTSKATSTTVQDVHPDIARGMIRKRPGKLRAYIPM